LLEGRTLLTARALDTSFGGTGEVTTLLSEPMVPEGLAVQSDLKTVVVGLEASPKDLAFNFYDSLVLLRYDVNGTLDSTFGTGGEVILPVNATRESFTLHNASIAIQPNG
jgi:hypothetical protein